MSRAADIEAALSYLDPDVQVEDTHERDGAQITVETGGQTYRFSIGNRRSVLLSYLLTGYTNPASHHPDLPPARRAHAR